MEDRAGFETRILRGEVLLRLGVVLVASLGAIATLVGMVLLWPSGGRLPEIPALQSITRVDQAEVIARDKRPCVIASGETDQPAVAGVPECQFTEFRLAEGPLTGEHVELPDQGQRGTELRPGDDVLLGYQPSAEPQFRYVLVDRDRREALFLLGAIFIVVVIAFGRLKGVTSLAGLASTVAVLLAFILPAILQGSSPVVVSVVGASAIAYLALYLSHGFSIRTSVALIGTLLGLWIALALAAMYMDLTTLTGLTTEEALSLNALGANVDIRGLMLGGMIIGALGVIDDMTVTQAAAVWELRAAVPSMSSRELLRAGNRIGRDHVASTVNTLVLAYAGAAMPVLILLVLSQISVGAVLSTEIIAIEIVRTLVGSIGLVLSVPITTWFAAQIATVEPVPTRQLVRATRVAGKHAQKVR
jgi:uncharacterized membrane protein